MIATRIYRSLDRLCGGEYYNPRQLLKYGRRAYQACMQWEEGSLKDSYFNEFLNKLIDKGVK